MSYKRTSQEAQAIAENVITLNTKELVYLMPTFDHQHFMKRAAAGHDVYAYKIELAPSGATVAFNVWDTDIRIPYSNMPVRWAVDAIIPQSQHRYVITFRLVATGALVHIEKYFHPKQGEDALTISERVNRHILAHQQHLNVFGGWPQSGLVS